MKMIKYWNETISADMLGGYHNIDEIIDVFAAEYEKELKKLLPNAEINVETADMINGHFIKIFDNNEEEVDELDYYYYSEKAWNNALKKF